jgi:hypothetical protein
MAQRTALYTRTDASGVVPLVWASRASTKRSAGVAALGLPSLAPANCIIHRTAEYGPVRTVVWEGRRREAPSYPDSVDFVTETSFSDV